MNDEFKPQHSPPERQEDPAWIRHLWKIVKAACTLIVVSVLTVKMAYYDTNKINFPVFDFSQLLSLLLAFFSIALSAMFYFKATDTSNAFYDRTYHFMKDLSEVLGRIEERFGERLQNIHEDTSGLRRDLMQSGNDNQSSPVATTEALATPDATAISPTNIQP